MIVLCSLFTASFHSDEEEAETSTKDHTYDKVLANFVSVLLLCYTLTFLHRNSIVDEQTEINTGIEAEYCRFSYFKVLQKYLKVLVPGYLGTRVRQMEIRGMLL